MKMGRFKSIFFRKCAFEAISKRTKKKLSRNVATLLYLEYILFMKRLKENALKLKKKKSRMNLLQIQDAAIEVKYISFL